MTNIQKDLFDAEEELEVEVMQSDISFAVVDDRHKVYYYKYVLCAYEDKLSDTVYLDNKLDTKVISRLIEFVNSNKAVKLISTNEIENYFERHFRI